MGSRASPSTEPSFFISLLSLCGHFADAATQTDCCTVDCTVYNKHIEDMQHLAANIEGPKK